MLGVGTVVAVLLTAPTTRVLAVSAAVSLVAWYMYSGQDAAPTPGLTAGWARVGAAAVLTVQTLVLAVMASRATRRTRG